MLVLRKMNERTSVNEPTFKYFGKLLRKCSWLAYIYKLQSYKYSISFITSSNHANNRQATMKVQSFQCWYKRQPPRDILETKAMNLEQNQALFLKKEKSGREILIAVQFQAQTEAYSAVSQTSNLERFLKIDNC